MVQCGERVVVRYGGVAMWRRCERCGVRVLRLHDANGHRVGYWIFVTFRNIHSDLSNGTILPKNIYRHQNRKEWVQERWNGEGQAVLGIVMGRGGGCSRWGGWVENNI